MLKKKKKSCLTFELEFSPVLQGVRAGLVEEASLSALCYSAHSDKSVLLCCKDCSDLKEWSLSLAYSAHCDKIGIEVVDTDIDLQAAMK